MTDDLLGRVRLPPRLLVMLSGGRDSVALLDLAARACADVKALHVDHRLRPDSATDAEFCAELCGRVGVELEVVRLAPPPASGNRHGWARARRYAAAAEVAGERDVATGHTATDQVETVLYRLAASPGRRALLGMHEREGRLVRPLLGVTRAQTAAHCRARGLPWREDPSNDDPRFARARVRHGLLEALSAVHPAAEANVLATLALLRDEAEVLDGVVDPAGGDLAALRALPAALRRLAVQRLADEACPAAPAVGRRADEILALDAGAVDLGGGLRAVVESGRLSMRAQADGDEPPPPASGVRLGVPGAVAFGDGAVSAALGEHGLGEGVLDADRLGPAVLVRPWRDGDRMRPLGLGGSRSLQDLFTDRKIPRGARRRLPVVVAGGEIAWVPGVATGDDFRVTGATERRVRLAWVGSRVP